MDPENMIKSSEEAAVESVSNPETAADLTRGMKLTGTIGQVELYGALLNIGLDRRAILHKSRVNPKPTGRLKDALKVGDELTVYVELVDKASGRPVVSMFEPPKLDWSDIKIGQLYEGTVEKLEQFGAFVNIGAEKEGLVHVSQLSHDYIKHPSEAVNVGDTIEVRVVGVNKQRQRLDLSVKAVNMIEEAAEGEESEEDIVILGSMEIALRQAMGGGEGPGADDSRRARGKRKNRKGKRPDQDALLRRTLKMGQELEE